jgi:glycerol-3-phosphate acyltransferase PlsY
MTNLLLILACYVWGTLSPAYLAARVLGGIDLRRYGSGNVGSTNVGEQVGRAWMFGIGSVDLLKGLLPIVLARAWGLDEIVIGAVGLATVLGHHYPFYLGFKGGRGMATTIGVLFAWDVRLALVLLLFVLIGFLARWMAPALAVGLLALAPGAWLLSNPPEMIAANGLLALLVFVKRLEANRLPLPADPREKRAVLLRRLWWDRDVPPDQPWQERGRFE